MALRDYLYQRTRDGRIFCGDVLSVLQHLKSESVHAVVTSPPYWRLRNYQIKNQYGQERTLSEYINNQVQVFREVRRVLRDDGTLWLNMGDSWRKKQLQMIPHQLALALQNDGWYLRSDIIWYKSNPLVNAQDRPILAHEYLFLLTKSKHYYYDAEAIRVPASGPLLADRHIHSVWKFPTQACPGVHTSTFPEKLVEPCVKSGTSEMGCCNHCGAPFKRIVKCTGGAIGPGSWNSNNGALLHPNAINKKACNGTYKRKTLGWKPTCSCRNIRKVRPVVLDPYAGALTTALVARKLNRRFIAIDIQPKFLKFGLKRLATKTSLKKD